jgi:allophanate hydrolase subunit 2
VATQQRDGLGGLRGDGQALRAGDLLVCQSVPLAGAASVPPVFQPDYALQPCIRVIPGGDAMLFGEQQLQGFFQHNWRISPHSDRMGARLYGTALACPVMPAARQWSQGVSTGAIQVPPDGQPILLMADRQSMGGYPLIGWVHPLDLGLLAQCPAHHGIHFVQTSLAQTQSELQAFYRFFGR